MRKSTIDAHLTRRGYIDATAAIVRAALDKRSALRVTASKKRRGKRA